MPIPKDIHQIYFGFTDFYFIHFLSVASAGEVIKPDNYFMYNEKEPENDFLWECAKKYFTVVHEPAPASFRGVPLDSYQYKADITRMEKLIQKGGMYMDIDVLTLKPFDHLFEKDCVVGAENGSQTSLELKDMSSITNAVIMCEQGSKYITDWYEKISDNIFGKPWAYHAVCLPKVLLEQGEYNDVHIEPRNSFMPFCFRTPYVFNSWEKNQLSKLDNSYTIHLWETIWWDGYLSKIDVEYFTNNDTIFVDLFDKYLDILRDNIELCKQLIDNNYKNKQFKTLLKNGKIYFDLCKKYNLDTEFDPINQYISALNKSNQSNTAKKVYEYILQTNEPLAKLIDKKVETDTT
jgi:hypothetical protein